jgi:hypothetical protein
LGVLAIPTAGSATAWIQAAATAAPASVKLRPGLLGAAQIARFQLEAAAYIWVVCAVVVALLGFAAIAAWTDSRRAGLVLNASGEIAIFVLLACAYGVWSQANSCLGTNLDPCIVSLAKTGNEAGTAMLLLAAAAILAALALALLLETLLERSAVRSPYRPQTKP